METALANRKDNSKRIAELLVLIAAYEAKGFFNCENVREAKGEIEKLNFDRYKDKYPNYLFFTNEQFDEIVKRNELVISTVEAYTGKVPDECLRAIQTEEIQSEDVDKIRISFSAISSTTKNVFKFNGPLNEVKSLGKKDIESIILRVYNDDISDTLKSMYGKNYDTEYPFTNNRKIRENTEFEIRYDNPSGLFIACPSNMIDKSIKFKDKIISFIVRQKQPTDPIVFRYVNDGVLVITFWK